MRQFGQRQFSGLHAVTIPDVTDVRDGVTYGLLLLLTGTLDVAGGTGYPDESDVRDGIVYGSSDEFLGTLVVDVLVDPDLSEGNLSVFEESEFTALNSYYVMHGIDAQYFEHAIDETKWIKVFLLSRMESISHEGQIQYENETLTVLIRRYSGTDHYAVDRPAKGDRLSVPSFDGTRKYTLTQTPVVSSGQLEWKAEFSRSKQKKVGGKNVVMNNS